MSRLDEQSGQSLFPVSRNGLYGAIDIAGNLVIQPRYKSLTYFSEGLAAFVEDDRYGLIDRAGNVVCSPRFDDTRPFSEGYAEVQIGEKWGFINRVGELVVPYRFYDVNAFSHGLAPVRESMLSKTGYIDFNGAFRIEPQFAIAGAFREGLASVLHETSTGELGKHGYIGTNGSTVIPPRFTSANRFSEGLAAVAEDEDGEVVGFVDRTGAYQINPQFEGADIRYSEGLAAVWREGLGFGYIDRSGNVAIPYQYYFADHFVGGVAQVGIKRKGHTWYGYINHDGDFILEPKFKCAESFERGLAWVSTGERKGFINIKGDYVWLDT